MRTRAVFAVIAAGAACAAVAGCEGRPEKEAPPTKITNPWHDRLAALPSDLQRIGVMRAIRDNGHRCHRVVDTRYQEDYRSMAMWVALCDEGRHFGIFIAVNGDTQVRDCAQMRQLGLPQCRPLTMPPDPARSARPSAPAQRPR